MPHLKHFLQMAVCPYHTKSSFISVCAPLCCAKPQMPQRIWVMQVWTRLHGMQTQDSISSLFSSADPEIPQPITGVNYAPNKLEANED